MHRGQRPRSAGHGDSPSPLLYGRVQKRREKHEEPTKDVADIVAELLAAAAATTQPPARSAGLVLECLEVALAKLDREPRCRLAGSGFFDRTVVSMVSAISHEIEAARTRRPWLLKGVEVFQERLQYFTCLLAETEMRCKDEDAIGCRQLDKSTAELQEAVRCQRLEEEQMQTTRATLEALKQRAREAEDKRLEEQQRQREQLLEYKDGLKRFLGKLREEYEQDQADLRQLKEEEKKLEHKRDVIMLEVADLPELEQTIASLEEQHAMLQAELQRLIAAAPRGRSTAHKPSSPKIF